MPFGKVRRAREILGEPTTGLGLAALFGLFVPQAAPWVPEIVNWAGMGVGIALSILAPEAGVGGQGDAAR